jgi:hypothetical protein
MCRTKLLGLGFLLLPDAGCAPALSSFTPAHVAPRKHVQAEVGLDVSIPTGTIGEVVDAGEALADNADDRELSDEEQEQLFRAGAALALNPPSATPHFGVAYTVLDHFEIGGRYSIGALRLAARYQLLEQAPDGIDLTVGLGGARYVYEFPISDQIPFVHLEDFTRWQLDFPVLVGKHGSWYRIWAGPRALVTFYGTELTFEQPEIPGVTGEKTVAASIDGVATYLGAQVGAAIGYKYVFFGFELTCAKFWTSANLKLPGREREVDLESLIIYPGFALMLEL